MSFVIFMWQLSHQSLRNQNQTMTKSVCRGERKSSLLSTSKYVQKQLSEHFVFALREIESVFSVLFLASLHVFQVWSHLSLGWLGHISGERCREKWSLHVCDVVWQLQSGSQSHSVTPVNKPSTVISISRVIF